MSDPIFPTYPRQTFIENMTDGYGRDKINYKACLKPNALSRPTMSQQEAIDAMDGIITSLNYVNKGLGVGFLPPLPEDRPKGPTPEENKETWLAREEIFKGVLPKNFEAPSNKTYFSAFGPTPPPGWSLSSTSATTSPASSDASASDPEGDAPHRPATVPMIAGTYAAFTFNHIVPFDMPRPALADLNPVPYASQVAGPPGLRTSVVSSHHNDPSSFSASQSFGGSSTQSSGGKRHMDAEAEQQSVSAGGASTSGKRRKLVPSLDMVASQVSASRAPKKSKGKSKDKRKAAAPPAATPTEGISPIGAVNHLLVAHLQSTSPANVGGQSTSAVAPVYSSEPSTPLVYASEKERAIHFVKKVILHSINHGMDHTCTEPEAPDVAFLFLTEGKWKDKRWSQAEWEVIWNKLIRVALHLRLLASGPPYEGDLDVPLDTTSDEPLRCLLDDCDHTTKKTAEHHQHVQNHIVSAMFCPQCKKLFSGPLSLDKHFDKSSVPMGEEASRKICRKVARKYHYEDHKQIFSLMFLGAFWKREIERWLISFGLDDKKFRFDYSFYSPAKFALVNEDEYFTDIEKVVDSDREQ